MYWLFESTSAPAWVPIHLVYGSFVLNLVSDVCTRCVSMATKGPVTYFVVQVGENPWDVGKLLPYRKYP